MRIVEPTFVGVETFLPDNIPASSDLAEMVYEQADRLEEGERFRRLAAAVGKVTQAIISDYQPHLLELEEVIEKSSGNCFAFTAVASIIGRSITEESGVNFMPAVRTDVTVYGQDFSKDFHAFVIAKSQDSSIALLVDRLRQNKQVDISPIYTHQLGKYGSMIAQKIEEGRQFDDILQVRHTPNGEFVLIDSDTQTKHQREAGQTYITETGFFGDRGLESFLATHEVLRAKQAGETANIFHGQLVPRL